MLDLCKVPLSSKTSIEATSSSSLELISVSFQQYSFIFMITTENYLITWMRAAADLPAPAAAPIGTKRCGKAGVNISNPKAAFSRRSANSLHPLGLTSKCLPYLDNMILLK